MWTCRQSNKAHYLTIKNIVNSFSSELHVFVSSKIGCAIYRDLLAWWRSSYIWCVCLSWHFSRELPILLMIGNRDEIRFIFPNFSSASQRLKFWPQPIIFMDLVWVEVLGNVKLSYCDSGQVAFSHSGSLNKSKEPKLVLFPKRKLMDSVTKHILLTPLNVFETQYLIRVRTWIDTRDDCQFVCRNQQSPPMILAFGIKPTWSNLDRRGSIFLCFLDRNKTSN